MSHSERSPSLCRVVVNAADDTEVFLIDHAFQLVKRSVGRFDAQVPPGLYKVKFRLGETVREITAVLSPDQVEVEVPVPMDLRTESRAALRAESAASLSSAQASMVPALDDAPHGDESELAISISRNDESDGSPLDGLTLLDDRDNVVADFSDQARVSSRTTTAVRALPPGSYRFHLSLGEYGTLGQTIVLSPRWRTVVHAGQKSYALRGAAPMWRADLADATILMAPSGEPDVSPELSSLAPLVKAWLAGPQLTIAMTHAQRLVETSISDPFFGLCVAHTLVRQSEIDKGNGRREPKVRRALLKNLVEKLEALIPGHPDLEALSTWLGRKPGLPFATPPMLLNSWTIVSSATMRRPGLVPMGSLSSLIAPHIWSSPIWLLWRADLVSVPEPSAPRMRRSQIVAELMPRLTTRASDEHGTFNDLERALWQALERAAPSKSAAPALSPLTIKQLGVPSATVDQALASMLDKLKD